MDSLECEEVLEITEDDIAELDVARRELFERLLDFYVETFENRSVATPGENIIVLFQKYFS